MVDQYIEQGRVRYADSLKAEDFAEHAESEAVYMVRTARLVKKASPDSNLADAAPSIPRPNRSRT